MNALSDHYQFTPAEYLEWEARQEIRHEYLDGVAYIRDQAYGMAGGTLAHNDLALNVYSAIRSQVRQRGCRVNVADVKVQVSETGPFFYPDVVVSCHPEDQGAGQFIRFPCLIVEVLSPATEAYDRGVKFGQYRRLSSLQEYVLISSERVEVDVFRLNTANRWELVSDGNEIIELSSIDLNIDIETIYDGVQFIHND